MWPVVAVITIPAIFMAGVRAVEYTLYPAPPMPAPPPVPAGGSEGAVTRPGAVDEIVAAGAAATRQRNEEFFESHPAAELPTSPDNDDALLIGAAVVGIVAAYSLLPKQTKRGR